MSTGPLACRNHCIDATPFEAFHNGSWHGIDRIRVKDAQTCVQLSYDGHVREERIDGNLLRMRSRKANSADCSHALKSGVDICVLSARQVEDAPDHRGYIHKPLWRDGQIILIKKVPHGDRCSCLFSVMIYRNKFSTSKKRPADDRWVETVSVDSIAILQKLQKESSEDGYNRWNTTKDCFSFTRSKLLNDTFAMEVACLIVLSEIRGMSFDLKLVENNIVPCILDSDKGPNSLSESLPDYVTGGACTDLVRVLRIICFQSCNEKLRHTIQTIVTTVPREVTHQETMEPNHDNDNAGSDSDVELLYDITSLRQSKRLKSRHFQREIYEPPYSDDCCDQEPDSDDWSIENKRSYRKRRKGQEISVNNSSDSCSFEVEESTVSNVHQKEESKEEHTVHQYSAQKDTVHQYMAQKDTVHQYLAQKDTVHQYLAQKKKPHKYSARKNASYQYSKQTNTVYQHLARKKTVIKCKHSSSEQGNTGLSFTSKVICSKLSERRKQTRKLLSSRECKEMIEDCIGNIKLKIKNPSESFFQGTTLEETYVPDEPAEFIWAPTNVQEEKDEHEELWKEMDNCLTTLSFLEQKQAVDSQSLHGRNGCSERDEGKTCKHEYELNEEIGLICRFCKHVSTEIRYITPSFMKKDGGFKFKEKYGAEKFDWIGKYDLEFDPSGVLNCPWEISLLEGCNNVWSLIPDIKSSLHPHQVKAFEFIWRNTAGSLNPEEMDQSSGKGGGCVISHTPGSGKTFLVISFVVSYLRLFPRSRPLILAPKSAVHTWKHEFRKWGVSFPVHFIYRDNNKEILLHKFNMPSRGRRPSRTMLQIMDCLETFKKWHEQPSILIMNYSSFLTLSKVTEKLKYSTFIANVLQNSPGLLILDEGHNPRSTRSKLRKLLMNVKTELRVLLSGTLFQNNFEEYFNTLSLARPRFINEVMSELDPYTVKLLKNRNQKQMKQILREEKIARKLFVERVGQNIESNEAWNRKQGFDLLSRLTSNFIDAYEAKMTDVLPGLQIYTLWLASTALQQELFLKLHKSLSHKRYPIEVELLVTIGCIHPSLVTTVNCAGNFFSQQELENVRREKQNAKCGPKTKFVVDLVQKSSKIGEKVLIFCHNIEPLKFLVELFEFLWGWKKEKEVLVLQGVQDFHCRSKIMDSFNNDTSGQIKVLLASTTACAEGISLTAASRLVMLDSEWNYSKTRQAIARAFRPGQERIVYVYLLLASGTWEEEKYESNSRKAWMAEMTFRGRYFDYFPSRKVEFIEDELLRQILEEDNEISCQMITMPT